ncbi:MAG TPA: hypothetical protein VFD58_27015 [Blastocatellia bacterium]|nr:hypothetical protein [Blastocatellia bacterium]
MPMTRDQKKILALRRTMLAASLLAVIVAAQESSGPVTRIQFKRGATSATYKGVVSFPGGAQYVLGARAGQQMSVKVESPNRSVSFQITGPDYRKVTEPADNSFSEWSGTLKKTGDYHINLATTEDKARYTLTVSITGSATAPAGAAAGFAGSWAVTFKSGAGFGIDLVQKGDRLTGWHSAVTSNASRVDAVERGSDEPSIRGRIEGTTATVTFTSGYGDGKGKARLMLQDGKLQWQITESTGEHYLPDKAVLSRERRR